MNFYSYINKITNVVVFQTKAQDILSADKLYEQQFGKPPMKQNHVGCFIEFNV